MTVGISTTNNKDLDDVFDLIPSGATPAANSGITYGASPADLSTRYAPLSLGSAAAATGIAYGGSDADLNTLYAAKGSTVLALHITTNQTNLNLRTWADGQTGGSYPYSSVKIYVDAGVVLSGSTDTGAFPIPLTVVNNGSIYGAGGDAGLNAEDVSGGTRYLPTDGSAGGDALVAGMNFYLQNLGSIYGGGGGGGGISDAGSYGYSCVDSGVTTTYAPGSGGGQGSPGGAATVMRHGVCVVPAQAYGTAGTVSAPGVSGLAPSGATVAGGDGGAWGQAGTGNSAGGTVGGAGGKAVSYAGYTVTWIGAHGDVKGLTA